MFEKMFEVKVPFEAAYLYKVKATSKEEAMEIVSSGLDHEDVVDVEANVNMNDWIVYEVNQNNPM